MKKMWIDNISTFHTWTSCAENTVLSSRNLKVTDHCPGTFIYVYLFIFI